MNSDSKLICPNCLTNEWNWNKNQVCIHCRLDLSHIDLTVPSSKWEGFFRYKKGLYICKEPLKPYKGFEIYPFVYFKKPWIMMFDGGGITNFNTHIVYIKHEHFWSLGTVGGEWLYWKGNYSVLLEYEKKYPQYNITSLIVSSSIPII